MRARGEGPAELIAGIGAVKSCFVFGKGLVGFDLDVARGVVFIGSRSWEHTRLGVIL